MRSAEVVAVGAGVIGASVAYHLAEKGCDPVLVLDGEASRTSPRRFYEIHSVRSEGRRHAKLEDVRGEGVRSSIER